ncbi:subtilase-type protease inhibitor [Streptomyces sp. GMY02]|uniref:SSI family serine proteinase inhibitor n=1 Tax=Streptomyces sp. GMY02 TaxID=1333528 RepID=UPI001C2C9084|nr:SSI family serine proteinase inhibitor [Streptomyces sp. GMY02]QXE38705.1 subtilase-type protease inhibitor [Streptomyces sp. GMY02]
MKTELGILLAVMTAVTAGAAASVVAVPEASAAPRTVTALSELTMTKSGSMNQRVTLECDPTGGTHPTPEDACTKLAAVKGQFDLLPRTPGVACPGNYAPVTVTVTGHWELQPVNFTKTYTNNCHAGVGSDYVFRF